MNGASRGPDQAFFHDTSSRLQRVVSADGRPKTYSHVVRDAYYGRHQAPRDDWRRQNHLSYFVFFLISHTSATWTPRPGPPAPWAPFQANSSFPPAVAAGGISNSRT